MPGQHLLPRCCPVPGRPAGRPHSRLNTTLLSLKSFHCWYHLESLCSTTPSASLGEKVGSQSQLQSPRPCTVPDYWMGSRGWLHTQRLPLHHSFLLLPRPSLIPQFSGESQEPREEKQTWIDRHIPENPGNRPQVARTTVWDLLISLEHFVFFQLCSSKLRPFPEPLRPAVGPRLS